MLRTLGPLQLDGHPLTRPKTLTFLAYLALAGPVSRRYAREVFWGVGSSTSALRVVLNQLRKENPELVIENQDLLSSPVDSDVKRFLLAAQRHHHEQALLLYQGHFLETVDFEMGEELEEWVQTTRESLLRHAIHAAFSLAEQHARLHDWSEVSRRVHQGLHYGSTLGFTFEEKHQARALLIAAGDPAARFFDACAIPEEAPEEVTAFQREKMMVLPEKHRALLGRENGLQELLEQVKTQRLTTITGIGGSGKTTLASHLIHHPEMQTAFQDGVGWIDLQHQSASQWTDHVAKMLQVPLSEHESWNRILQYLQPRHVLLVLNHFEHLHTEKGKLEQLLQHCPNVHLLVTSRARLGLSIEKARALSGLENEQASIDLMLQGIPAERIQMLKPTALQHLVRQVQHHPLSLQQLGHLLKFVSPTDLLKSLQHNPRETTGPGQGMMQVFESTCLLLPEDIQQKLFWLGVFEEGFDLQASIQVAGFGLAELQVLHDHNLIQLEASDRYTLHPLFLEHLRHSITPEQCQNMSERHHQHYVRERLQQLSEDGLAAEFSTEEANITKAIKHAVKHQMPDTETTLYVCLMHFERQGTYRAGLQFFQALCHLPELHNAVQVILEAHTSWMAFRCGDYDTALTLAERALVLAPPGTSRAILMQLHNTLGTIHLQHDREAQAEGHFREALKMAMEINDPVRMLRYRCNLATCQMGQGKHEEAAREYQFLLGTPSLRNDVNLLAVVVLAWSHLQLFHVRGPHVAQVVMLLEEVSQRCQKAGLSTHLQDITVTLGHAYLQDRQYEKVLECVGTITREMQGSHHPVHEIDAVLLEARAYTLLRQLPAARNRLMLAIHLMRDQLAPSRVVDSLLYYADLVHLEGSGNIRELQDLSSMRMSRWQKELLEEVLVRTSWSEHPMPLDLWLNFQWLRQHHLKVQQQA